MKLNKLLLLGLALLSFKSVAAETEYVDLGLASGTLWASSNVGATAPEEAGTYYAWGEWNKDLKVPSKEELNELIFGCEWSIEQVNGKNAVCAKSLKNGNKIYFPFSGYKKGEVKNAEYLANIWSCTENDAQNACFLYFYNAETLPASDAAIYGSSAKTKGRNVRTIKSSK